MNAREEIEIKLRPPPRDRKQEGVPRIAGGTKAIKGQFRGAVSDGRLFFF